MLAYPSISRYVGSHKLLVLSIQSMVAYDDEKLSDNHHVLSYSVTRNFGFDESVQLSLACNPLSSTNGDVERDANTE